MKHVFYGIQQFLLVCVVLLTGALFEFSFAGIVGGGVAYASATGLMVKFFSDPQTLQKWEKQSFRLGETKTEFNEAEIGTVFTSDGPMPSQLTSAPPILYHNELQSGGRKVNIEYHQPLKEGIMPIMNTGRYRGQDRLGYEEKMDRQHVVTIADSHHLGVREDEIEIGDQNSATIGIGKLTAAFVEKLTDYHAQRKDLGLFFGFFARYDLHSFINTCIDKGVSNGAKPVADADGGLLSPPREHPNTYVWHKTDDVFQFEKVTYHDTAATHSNNISTAASKITPEAKPNIALLYRIMRTCERTNMIPCSVRLHDGRLHKYFMVYMPGRMKDLLEQDDDVKSLYNSAYQGLVEKNPFLNQDDLKFKNLIIRSSNRLEDEIFSYKTNFNVDGGTDAEDAEFNIVGSDVKTGTVSLAFGDRDFAQSSAAAAASGFTPDQIGRIMVLGANAVAKVSGKSYNLEPMEVSQYGRDAGLGQTHFFGNQLIVRRKAATGGLEIPTAPQSFQIFAFMGNN